MLCLSFLSCDVAALALNLFSCKETEFKGQVSNIVNNRWIPFLYRHSCTDFHITYKFRFVLGSFCR